MALERCRECGKDVSTEAATCPYCGVPRPTERRGATSASPAAGRDYVSRTLTSGERVHYRTRLHWISLLPGLAIAAIALAAAIALLVLAPAVTATLVAVAAILLFALIIALVEYLKYVSSEFAVTDARVLIKLGWIRRRSIEILVAKVESIVVDQPVLGRLLDYGTVIITGTGGTREAFDQIAAPLELREQVQAQIVAERGRG